MRDALYRVIRASFSYTQDDGPRTTGDMSSDWRDSQRAIREANADPMDQEPAPMVPEIVDRRVGHIEWQWDWLGNTQTWNDDADSFCERSIGNIVNGNDTKVPGNPTAPYAPALSTSPRHCPRPPTVPGDQDVSRNGWVELEYGLGGNVDLTACYDPVTRPLDRRLAHLRANCECRAEQYYEYRWHELNRLSEAKTLGQVPPRATWGIAVPGLCATAGRRAIASPTSHYPSAKKPDRAR